MSALYLPDYLHFMMVNLDSMLESSSMMIFKLKSEEDPGQRLQDPEALHYQQIALG